MLADLIVLGAGPAGTAAALAAARAGLDVLLLDEAAAPDQVHRTGDRLRRALARSGVRTRWGRRVWSVVPGFRVDALGPAGPECYAAPRLVAATGAVERVVPFPGWTLPGVIGLAGATTLLKAQGMAPGRRVVVAGCGPLLAAVAARLADADCRAAGVSVAAVVDLSARADWLAALPGFATRPALLARGAAEAARLLRRRVPLLFRHAVLRAEGDGALARVLVAPVDAAGTPCGDGRWIEADALCIGHGLVPTSDIPRLLRAPHRFDAAVGGWVPVLDKAGRTGLPGLFAAGDGAGIAGAGPAARAGRRAGTAAAAAADAGAGRLRPGTRASRGPPAAAGAANALMRPRPGLLAAMPADTVVCRCEDVTRAAIEAAIDAGAREMNQLKHFTRCGMGPCGGRICAEAAAGLLARHVGGRDAAGQWTLRPPLRPVPLHAMLGSFTYADIPVPTPAPL